MSQADSIYRTRDQIVSDVLAAWAARIPDVGVGADTVIRIWTEVFANTTEGVFLGIQLLHDDIFIQSMSALALQREGSQLGRPQKAGTIALGSVLFSGTGGTFIGQGAEVGAPRPLLGDTLVFTTTEDVTIPDPGIPGAPAAADAAVAGNLTGTMEWAVTFTTAEGETEIGAASNAIVLAASKGSLTAIPLGGPGTTSRKIYRRKNGGAWTFVHTLADNATTIYTDNIADGSLGGAPPAESTAERVTATAAAEQAGSDYDVAPGTVTSLVSVEGDVTGVTNVGAFTGGEDEEAIEAFRQALLQWARNPQSGSADDLIAWATSIAGIDNAAVFKNVNLDGDPELGSVVIRVAGPGGAVPSSDLQDAVEAYIASKDLANITIYIGVFDPLVVNVSIQVAALTGYTTADVASSVEDAVAAYINSVPTGGVVFVSGIVHSAFALPGVETVQVNTPADDVAAGLTEKPVAGVVTVTEWIWS